VNGATATTVPSLNKENSDLVQAIGRYDLGGTEVTVVAGYLHRKQLSTFDISPFYVPILPFFGIPPGFVTEIALVGLGSQKNFTAEARIASTGNRTFGWLAGASYRDSKYRNVSDDSTSPGTLPFSLLQVDQRRLSKSYALFAEVTLQPVQGLTLLAGLRHYEDKVRFASESNVFGAVALDAGQDTFSSLNPRFNIQYEFSRNSMVYLNAAKGFRSGGFNLTSAGCGVVTVPPTYAPDKVWTYEAGTKHTLLDGKLFFDATVYRTTWDNIQSSVFAPGGSVVITTNSGKVKGWGVDLSATVKPVAGLTLSAAYGWNNLHFTEVASGGFVADKIVGDPVDFAVREAYAVSADYRVPIAEETALFFRADYQHAGKSQVTLRNFGNQIVARPSRDLVNVRAGVELGEFEISAFARNLFNEDAPNVTGPYGAIGENVEQQPRVIGIQGRARF